MLGRLQTALSADRTRAQVELDQLFRSGRVPSPPLDGRYRGEIVLVCAGLGLNQIGELLSRIWLPWQGKTFDAERATGANILTTDALLATRLYWPRYRGAAPDRTGTFQAFRFRTSVAASLADPDCTVLRIGYKLPENPRVFIDVCAIVDEVVEIGENLYLGKAYFRLPWGGGWPFLYFTLRPEPSAVSAEQHVTALPNPITALVTPRALAGTFLPLAILLGMLAGTIAVIRKLM